MWLKRPRAGKLHYRPLDEYALREYSVTRKELDHFVRTVDRQIARDQKAGKIKIYSSNLEADLAD
jgi:hypothetical protein